MISFIIPHYGREHLLAKALQSIADQDYDLNLIEVIIVTQNKELSKSVLDFGQQMSLSVLKKPASSTISELRNAGVKLSKGDYIAFIDADVSISSNWVACMLEELEESDEGRTIVSAIQSNSESATSVESIRTALNNINRDKNVEALHGSNLFLRRDAFKLAGGFPSKLKTCEDVYFTTEVSKYGPLYLSSKATHIHLGEDKDYRVLFKKEIWRGQSNIQSLKGRKVSLREMPSIIIPLSFFMFLILSTILFIYDLYILSFICVILFLFPVLIYSFRLVKYSNDKSLKYIDCIKFYLVYFSARSIGTYMGLLVINR